MTDIITTGLGALLQRVQATAGIDRELDLDLAWDLWPEMVDYDQEEVSYALYSYTGSIDAALALVERLLPGTRLSMVHWDQWHAEFLTPDENGENWLSAMNPTAGTTGSTLPLAILAALLTAFIAQQKEAQ